MLTQAHRHGERDAAARARFAFRARAA